MQALGTTAGALVALESWLSFMQPLYDSIKCVFLRVHLEHFHLFVRPLINLWENDENIRCVCAVCLLNLT